MNEGAQPANLIRFGVFEVDLRTQELRKDGTRIRLPAQSFQVIAMLLRRPGQLVTREELQHKLWPAESFGDFEHGLNAAVNRVREALGDSAENPKFVETLPRRGYRFIAAVEPEALNVNGAVQEVVNASIAEPATTSNVPEGGSTHTADAGRERTR
jgi:cholera toxin transcriptional activator